MATEQGTGADGRVVGLASARQARSRAAHPAGRGPRRAEATAPSRRAVLRTVATGAAGVAAATSAARTTPA
jgi:hypothetical protein